MSSLHPCFRNSLDQPQELHLYTASIAIPRRRQSNQLHTRSYVVEQASWLLQDVKHVLMADQRSDGRIVLDILAGPMSSHRLFNFLDAIGGEHFTDYCAFSPQDPYGAINYYVDCIHQLYEGWDPQQDGRTTPWRQAGDQADKVYAVECQEQNDRQNRDTAAFDAYLKVSHIENAAVAQGIANGVFTTLPGGETPLSLTIPAENQLERFVPASCYPNRLTDWMRRRVLEFTERLEKSDCGELASHAMKVQTTRSRNQADGLILGRYRMESNNPPGESVDFIVARLTGEKGYKVLLDYEYREILAAAQDKAAKATQP